MWDFPTGVRFVDISPNDIIKYKKFLNELYTKTIMSFLTGRIDRIDTAGL
jgi:hypothetical protein